VALAHEKGISTAAAARGVSLGGAL
jgi:hypothetical protein